MRPKERAAHFPVSQWLIVRVLWVMTWIVSGLASLFLVGLSHAGHTVLVTGDNAGANTRFDSNTRQLSPWDAIPDGDLDICRTYLDGKTEVVLTPEVSPTSQAHLVVRAFDVDSTAQPEQGYAFPEQDHVFFNNQMMGQLQGAFREWSMQLYPLTLEMVHQENLLAIDIDVLGQQAGNALWCMALDWGQLVVDRGPQEAATIHSMTITQVASTQDRITLTVQVEVTTNLAGDYHLELSLIDQQAVVHMVQGTFNDELRARAAAQTQTLAFHLSYEKSALPTGYYGIQALLFDSYLTQDATWPTSVQDVLIQHFYHPSSGAPQATLFLDSDGDGLLDQDERNVDDDGDGIVNVLDVDDDGDGLSSRFEHHQQRHIIDPATRLNTDGDAYLNYLDDDDDNDGRPSMVEGPYNDQDNDGVLDYLDAADQSPCFPNIRHDLCDADSDGVINQLDNDDDGDQIEDGQDHNIATPALTDLIVTILEGQTFVMDVNDGSGGDTDADGDVMSYQLLATQDFALFSVHAETGILSLVEAVDFEAGKHQFDIQIKGRANNEASTFGVRVIIKNEDDEPLQPLTDVDSRANEIYENALINTEVGLTVQGVDPDGDEVEYHLTENPGGHFSIDPQSGVVRVATTNFDYQTQDVFDIEVTASSTPSSGQQTSDFRIYIKEALADSDGDGTPDIDDEDSADPCVPNAQTSVCAIYLEEKRKQSEEHSRQRNEENNDTVNTGNQGMGGTSFWLMCVLLLVLLPRGAVWAAPWFKTYIEDRRLYLGAGAGNSGLNPETQGTDYRVDGNKDAAWKLNVGLEWNQTTAIEAYYSDLGHASFADHGLLKYQVKGASVVQQIWMRGASQSIGNIAALAKIGANMLTNQGKGVSYERNSVIQPYLGLGGEYFLANQLSIRGEYEWFGSDATLMSVTLVKRFGAASRRRHTSKPILTWDEWAAQKNVRAGSMNPVKMIESLPPTAATHNRIIRISPVVVDADRDGVLDDEDMCLHSLENAAVDEQGCVVVLLSKP